MVRVVQITDNGSTTIKTTVDMWDTRGHGFDAPDTGYVKTSDGEEG